MDSCKSVSQSVVWLICAKTAEWIDILFGVQTLGAQGTLYYVGVPDSRMAKETGELLPIVPRLNTTVLTDLCSPDGTTSDAAIT